MSIICLLRFLLMICYETFVSERASQLVKKKIAILMSSGSDVCRDLLRAFFDGSR